MWQVSGRSDITDFEEVVRLDKEYIENWNIGLDIKILLKTVLVVFRKDGCGIIPKEGSSLDEVLDRLGGGFEMHSEVTNVPKGSGLGTSSILSAACVKAVFEFSSFSSSTF